MEAKGYFMIGLPGDNEDSINKTINFAKSLPLDATKFSITVPYPSSKLFKTAEKYVKFQRKEFNKYSFFFPKELVFVAKGLNTPCLLDNQRKAYK